MPDGTQINCYNGSYSDCTVTHPNGQTGEGPAGALIRWLVERHREHSTDKAIENASATVLLTVKHSMHLTDMSTLLRRIGPYLPSDEKAQMEQLAGNLTAQSSAFSGAVSYFAANWNGANRSSYRYAAKGMEKLYDNGLLAVCGARISSTVLTAKLDSVRATLPADVMQALDAVKGDEALLSPECTSKQAIKLLNGEAEMVKAKPASK